MNKFTATFSNGQTVTRNSDHAYAFAWAVIRTTDNVIEASGFSADNANATKAAWAKTWKPVSTRDKKHPATRRYHASLAKHQGFASVKDMHDAWDANAAAHNAIRKIEVVAVN